MVATIMPSTPSLIARLQNDFPHIRFDAGNDFLWSPHEHIVYYADLTDTASLIHELAHAVLNHNAYTRDIDLIKIERDAWEYAATTLAPQYGLEIHGDEIQDSLDTYREWLHARSTCPSCRATGIQTDSGIYSCLACMAVWQVNEARTCSLRRVRLT